MNTDQTYNKKFVFAAACTGMLLFGIVMISLGALLPDINEKFKLDETDKGNLATLLPMGILVGSLLFGPLIDWLSYKKILIAGTIFTALGLLGLAITEALMLLNVSVFLVGLGGGILNGLTNALVSEISEGNSSANLSLLGVFFGIGALGTPVVLGLFEGIYSYEDILLALVLLIVGVVIFFLMIRFPYSKDSKGVPLQEGIKMLKDPLLLLFGFILFFQSGLEGLTNNWTTSYLEDIKNMNSSNALFALSTFVAALTITRLVLGKLLRMYKPFNIMLWGFLLALLGFILLYWGGNDQILFTALIVIGIGLAAAFPVILGYVGESYTKHAGTAFSIVITIALIGNVLGNYTLGQVSKHYSLTVFPYFLIIGVLAILVLLMRLSKVNFSGSTDQ